MPNLAPKSAAGEPWLEIDLKGFAQALSNKGIARIALEPISNALDTEATSIHVHFTQADGWATLRVSDDDPEGFADLTDSYTLYAPSRRRNDPTKRGRFGQGDKELIAICARGGDITVTSTTGTVSFTRDGRFRTRDANVTGTTLVAKFRCNRHEGRDFERLVGSLIAPTGIRITYNGDPLPERTVVRVAKASLPTKVADDDGNIVDATRQTEIRFYEPEADEKPTIYELGVPVVEHDGRWHINVGQKVPLAASRDNVTPSYLRRLREIALDTTFDLLTTADQKKGWVADALPKASPEAFVTTLHGIYGDDAVIGDPSNPEATKKAAEQGRAIIAGRSLNADTWNRVKNEGTFLPAGRVIETGISFDGGDDATDVHIPTAEWSTAMTALAAYTADYARHTIATGVTVSYANVFGHGKAGHAEAWYNSAAHEVTFNLGVLGKRYPADATGERIDALLNHELAHQNATDHYSASFYDECCRIGARARSFTGQITTYRQSAESEQGR